MDNIELTQQQIDNIASKILVSDVLSYIEKNRSAYENFLKEVNGEEVKDYDNRRIKKQKPMDKLELQTN